MSLIPDFSISICNAWLFMLVFPLQWLAVIIIPHRVSTRVSHDSDSHLSFGNKMTAIITNILWILATLYSIFIPLDTGKPWFYVGLAFFIIGLFILVSATTTVFKAAEDKPFTAGVYRYSRHPMYLSMVLIYIAVSVAAASWLFGLITIATIYLQRCQMIREEQYCSKKFGESYIKYMHSTPRWAGKPGKTGN